MEAVIFDLDGTLFDSRITIRRCLNATMLEYGKEPFGDDVKNLIGKHLMEILGMRGIDTEEAAERYRQIQMETYKQDMRIFEGVVDMLDILKKDHKLGVATMRHGRITGEIIEGMGMSHFFDILVGVDDTEKPKPHPEHVLTACKLLEVEPEAAVMVGDTIYDVLSGKGAGCYTIGIDWGSGKREDLLENGADHVASTMDGLLEHVLQLP